MLGNPKIQSAIQVLKDKRSQKVEVNAEMVLRELMKLGFSNLQDYVKEGFTIDDIAKLEKDKAAAIESIKVKTHFDQNGNEIKEVNFKLHDKLGALEKIAKHIGFFEADNRQKPGDKQVFVVNGQKFEF